MEQSSVNREQLLVSGYINDIDLVHLKVIPKDVIRLCFKFFFDSDDQTQHYLKWNVSNVRNIRKDSPTFTMKHCRFGFFVISSILECLMFKLMHHPSDIKQITINYELVSNNDDGKYTNINTVSFHFSSINTAFKKILNKNKNDHKKMTKTYTKIMEITKLKSSFSIELFTKILRIEYNNHKYTDFYSNPKIFSKIKCKWDITSSSSSESASKVTISNTFNDKCWCLVYDERRYEPKYELRLLCLPNGIGRMNVKLSYNVTINKRKNRRKQRLHTFNQHSKNTFSYEHNIFKWISQNKVLDLSIECTALYDMNREVIEECDWIEYGVCCNRKWANINLTKQ